MGSWKRIVGTALVVALSAGAGMAVAEELTGSQPPPTADDGASVAAGAKLLASGFQNEDSFVPITPCRILDTRQASAGRLVVGTTRTIDVRGDEATFTIQGGNPGGCGIPAGATSVEATVTAVDAGSGFLRAWPAGTSQPNATFLNYDDAFNVSNSGSLTLCGGSNDLPCIANQDLNLRAYGSNTHLVIDVSGFTVRKMAAYVSLTGVLQRSNRATTSAKIGTGQYEVTFDRNVSACTYAGALSAAGASGHIQIDPRNGAPNAIYVQTNNSSGTGSDRSFYVEVTC